MKQGRRFLSLCAALVILGAASPLPAHTAPEKSASAASKSKNATRQFSGTVTAVDRNSLTVEKHGKKAKTMVFSKHAEMKSSGDVEKNSRVTVYYREEGGHAVAMRVVVKPQATAAVTK